MNTECKHSRTHDGSKSAQAAVAENLNLEMPAKEPGQNEGRGGVGGSYGLYWRVQQALSQLQGWWTKGGLFAIVQVICISLKVWG